MREQSGEVKSMEKELGFLKLVFIFLFVNLELCFRIFRTGWKEMKSKTLFIHLCFDLLHIDSLPASALCEFTSLLLAMNSKAGRDHHLHQSHFPDENSEPL